MRNSCILSKILIFLTWLHVGNLLFAQESSDTTRVAETTSTAADEQQDALLLLNERLIDVRSKLKSAKNSLNDTLTNSAKESIQSEIEAHKNRIADLEREISLVATGIDPRIFDSSDLNEFKLEDQIKDLLEPVVSELKEATASQRETEELRNSLGKLKRKFEATTTAVANLQNSIDQTENESLKETLRNELEKWKSNSLDLKSRLSVAKYQLAEKERNSPSVVQALSNMTKNFFRSRGIHLLLAALAAIIIVLALNYFKKTVLRVSKKRGHNAQTFYGRLINLFFTVFTVFGATIGFILVLYLANDWVLLTLSILLLLGIIWAGKHTIPQFFEHGKLMLNLGVVRYGERVIYDGIPWQVQKINIFTDLVNPMLEGGLIRLPLRDLASLHSRPNGNNELWFPSQENDWIQLSDNTFGKVIQQTPDYVHLVKLGGSRKVVPTADFLGLHPENLSKNFRVVVTFGIDYEHQAISTTEVPPILEHAIKNALLKTVENKELLSLKVFFTSAGASSLDYRIVADFIGELAPRKVFFQDLIQRSCVDVCNDKGWIIPFAQITVHQAKEPVSDSEPQRPTLP